MYRGPERRQLDEEQKELLKEAFKEGAQEWLDDKFMTFGKWSATGIAAAALVALGMFILWTGGWHR